MNIRSDKAVMMAVILTFCMALPVSADDNAAPVISADSAAGAGVTAELNAGTDPAAVTDAGIEAAGEDVPEEADKTEAGDAELTDTPADDPKDALAANEADPKEDEAADEADAADEEDEGFVLEDSGVRYYVSGKGSISLNEGILSYRAGAGYHLDAVYVQAPSGDGEGASDGSGRNEEEINIDVLIANDFAAGTRVTLCFEPDETDGCRADNSSAAIYDGVLEGGGSDDM